MNQIAKVEQPGLPGVPDEPVTILNIINRAAFDPSVDADKIERLLNMAREFKKDEAKAAYAKAMIAMKPEMPVIDRKGKIVITDKNDKTKIIQSTPYALWEDIDAAITPILARHGFVLTFRTGAGAEGRITVTGVLTHEMGHSEESTMPLPLDTSGSKNNVQAAGSSTSYGKRYTATALLNIRTKGEDDDGENGGGEGFHSNPQRDAIHGSSTMKPQDDDIEEGVKNWCAEQKTFLGNCSTVAEVQDWLEMRKDALDRLRRKALPAWSDLMKFKEQRIGNINLQGVSTR